MTEVQDEKQDQFLIAYEYRIWNQRSIKIKIIIIDIERNTYKPLWESVDIKLSKNFERKDYRRRTYFVKKEDIIKLFKGKILKEVKVYQNRGKKREKIRYYFINDKIEEINVIKKNIKINGKCYDIVSFDSRKIMISR